MKLFLNIDKALKETRITIEVAELDENIQEIIDFINGREQQFLIGKKGEMQHILKPDDIQYFMTIFNGNTLVKMFNIHFQYPFLISMFACTLFNI